MSVVSITGAQFTVSVAAADYTEQVTSGTITTTPVIVRTKTLDSVAFNQTDLNSAISIEFLYDDNSGCYDAIQTAIATGSSVAVAIDGATGVWTGAAMYIDSAETTFEAAGVSMCSVSMQGTVVFA